jgi:tetratricopeptide (TPR) repeat protein
MEEKASIRKAEQNALTALRLDAQNGMAYATLANVYRQQNKWEQAVTTYKIALKHSPNDAQINYWYSITLRTVGEFDKAIQYSTKAIALDPLYPTILFGHIGNCSYAGKYEMARASMEEGKALFSDYYMYYYVRGFYYVNLGDYQAALKEFQTADSMNPRMKSIQSYIAFCQGKLGQQAAVKSYLASLTPTPDNYDGFAVAYAGLNDKEQCFHYLQLSAAQGHLPEYFKVSPLFKFLRGDKRFDELLQQFGLLNFKLPT